MDVHISPMVLVLLLCAVLCLSSTTSADNEDLETEDDYDFDDEYPNYDNEEETQLDSTNITTDAPAILSTTPPAITTSRILEFVNDAVAKPMECPTPCVCTNDRTKTVNCSSLGLTQIPKIPSDVVYLDLGHNQLESIPFNAFTNLSHLETLDLSQNSIQHIDADTFSGSALSVLSLANNPLVVPTNGALLNMPLLKELDLRECNLTQVYYDTFRNLTGLKSLNLRNNSFNDQLYVTSFTNLTQLNRLHIDSLPSTGALELCNLLTQIDIILTEKFGLSCFELTAGSTFEESTVTIAQLNKESRVEEETTTKIASTTKPTRTTTTTSTTTARPTPSISPPVKDSPTNISNSNVNVQHDVVQDMNANQTKSFTTIIEPSASKVNVSSTTLRHILIGIIVVAFVGLAIGLCCRRDIFGIKTKLCRSSVRGPSATDQVRPAEQVPLKEIELIEIKQKEVV